MPVPHDEYSKENQLARLEQADLENKRKVEKIENYSKYVKEMYWPKVSAKKQQELESLKLKNMK